MVLISLVLIFVLSAISFQGFFYFRMLPYLGVGWSYVLDESLPLLITLLVLGAIGARYLKKKSNRKNFLKVLKNHKVNFFLIFFSLLLSHGLLLKYYFFAEDITHVLGPVNNGILNFPFLPTNIGYPLMPFILSFLIFKTNAFFYNVISIGSFFFATLSFYIFLTILTKNRLIALYGSLFFVTTPVFLDMFSWQGAVSGMSFVLGLGLTSLTLLAIFRVNSKIIFYLLSILFFVSAVKTGFVRSAGLIIPLGYLIFFHLPGSKVWNFREKILFVTPYLIIFIMFFSRWFPIGTNAVGNNFKNLDYFPSLFYYIAVSFFPSKIAGVILPWWQGNATLGSISFAFVIGLFLAIVLASLLIISFLKKQNKFFWLLFYAVIFVLGGLFYVRA